MSPPQRKRTKAQQRTDPKWSPEQRAAQRRSRAAREQQQQAEVDGPDKRSGGERPAKPDPSTGALVSLEGTDAMLESVAMVEHGNEPELVQELKEAQRALGRIADRFRREVTEHGTPPDPDRVDMFLDLLFPSPGPWSERIGPVFTTGDLQQWLPGIERSPITDEAVRDRGRKGRLIGFRTADGKWAWPEFQFRARDGRLEVRTEVLKLWALLPWRTADHLELISWMTGRRASLNGETPLEYLDAHGLDDLLRQQAARFATRVAA